MTFKLLAFLLLYLALNFVLAALYVRFWSDDQLSHFYRKRFGFFPFFPVLLLMRVCQITFHLLARTIRFFFELLSGKPTYHRRKFGYYGPVRSPSRPRVATKKVINLKTVFRAKPAEKPRRVNDNETIRPVIPAKMSKY
ncbi:hypothetical protein SAMN02745824_3460 [Parasphingorhabdus marina DSM 22363]|uniref:Uncharacterized protein n=1 Tax=Parasphingorhabdus marina DSM 22363 TaxID=1123272 RepID=A0A1N6HUA1_9SPHN|nr:hypothetical protein [Parasphingorhabdus marina]SIO23290.1 hypothetical protein SAMN02745824_3460 [Parasphingorhabdus marina DSM 22363]